MNLLTSVLHHARLRPDAPAVVDIEGVTSYRELVDRAAVLAAGYREAGVAAGDRVVLLLPPGRDAVAAALAAFWLRAAYVPIDPVQPAARLRAMLEGCTAQLTVVGGAEDVQAEGATAAARTVSSLVSGAPAAAPVPGSSADLAYVIHTSGTTGRPKGVMVEHGNVLNLIADLDGRAPLPDGHRGSWWCSPDFDVAVWELWAPLVRGGTVHVVPGGDRLDPDRFLAFLDRARVQNAYVPPSFLPMLRDRLRQDPDALRAMLRILVGVEPIPLGLLREIGDLRPGLRIVNGYGPAETTICCTLYLVSDSPGDSSARTPIGTPVAGNLVRVLGPDGRPSTDGQGELVIGGVGVARGYMAPADADGRFHTAENTRWYRTGDLVRTLPDGNLEYLGRADRQLKVRGYRVEPAEVETALRAVLPLREAVVDERELPGFGSCLVAYLVADGPVTDHRVRQSLRDRLPTYAIPSRFLTLPALPLTRNGKVDRDALRALPLAMSEQPPVVLEAAGHDGRVPLTPSLIAAVWRQVLGTGADVDDDLGFIDLGGTSLAAVRTAVELERLSGLAVAAGDVLRARSAADLARSLRCTVPRTDEPTPDPVGRLEGPLSVNQLGIWLHDLAVNGKSNYLEPVCFELTGEPDRARLAEAVQRAAAAHPAFGAVVDDAPDEPVLRLARHTPHLTQRHLSPGLAEDELAELLMTEATSPMLLDEGPLMRCLLLSAGSKRHFLLFVWHHLVVDGWSARLFLEDLTRCYADPADSLDLSEVTVCDLNVRQQAHLRTPEAMARLRQAAGRLAGATAALPGPDPAAAATGERAAAVLPVRLAGSVARELTTSARRFRVTPFVLVCAAYRLAAQDTFDLKEFLLGCAASGRRHSDAMAVAGCLVNTVLLRFGPVPAAFDDLLSDTAQEVDQALTAQEDLPLGALIARMRQDDRTLPKRIPQLYLGLDEEYLLDLPGLDCRTVPIEPLRSKFEVTLALRTSPTGLSGVLEYLLDAVTPERAAEFTDNFRKHLRDLVRHRPADLNEEDECR